MHHNSDSLLGELAVDGLMTRAAAFEKDLAHYRGDDWKRGYEIRPAVEEYLSHLGKLEDADPYLLVAYVYHLYMGLLSGGQVLKAKKKVLMMGSRALSREEAIMSFGGGKTTAAMKAELRSATNRIAAELDEETREKILVEGVTVFEMNNAIIGSVRGVDEIFYRRLLICVVVLMALLAVAVKLFFY